MFQLSHELTSNLNNTMVNKYKQPEQDHITEAVDKLQQEVENNNNRRFIQRPFVNALNISDS